MQRPPATKCLNHELIGDYLRNEAHQLYDARGQPSTQVTGDPSH
jgi:hypothetical protein